jgi:hypothetical protein
VIVEEHLVFIRLLQLMMIRVQRTTFLALQYLVIGELGKTHLPASSTNSSPIKLRLHEPCKDQAEPPTPLSSYLQQEKEKLKNDLLELGIRRLMRALRLADTSLLEGQVDVRKLPSGTYFMQVDSQNDAALVLVITGTVSVFHKAADRNESVTVCVADQGGLVGAFGFYTGEPTFFTVSGCQVNVAMLSKATLYT